ncbi:formate/nitrite transporter family protein [Paracoccus litorisediminis]|uniref:formate/nitrite transporter family protein n=1 Tax=Paracoccus litorisediminis TaxID=2006130 RepID=UPI001B8D6242|nr:formate/nitrite transporter family protein [Paracoccus litorisediminis]
MTTAKDQSNAPAKAIPTKELEEHMPSKAATVHEILRREGERELSREVFALFWSALAGGITMSMSLVARGIFQANLPEIELGFLIEAVGYTFGFIFVIAAGQQLFTENTVTPVIPVLRRPSLGNIAASCGFGERCSRAIPSAA